MRETKENMSRLVLALIAILVVLVFGIGLYVPLGIAQGVLYVAPVGLSLWLPERRYTVFIAAVCSVLTVLGVFVSHPGAGPPSYVLINRAYSLVAIGMVVLIDRLHRQLVQRNEELVFRTTTLEALYEMGSALSSEHDVNTIKEIAVSRARQLLASDTAGLATVHGDSGKIRWQFVSGFASDRLRRIEFTLGEGIVGKAVQSGTPAVIEDALDDDASMAAPDVSSDEGNLKDALVVPIGVGGTSIGALMVGYRTRHRFQPNDIKLLAGLGDQVAVAMNNAQLLGRLRALSAMEERQRLAREMHDGLAQLLGNLTAQATASAELLAQGRLEDARQRLGRLREVAQIAYGEVRRSILGLRAASLADQGFLKMLDEFAVRIYQDEGLAIRVEVEPGINVDELAPPVEVQAIRIVQEALANVRKHSEASEVLVRVEKDDGWLTVSVQDNGRGFVAPEMAGGGGHLGLQIMRERAESVGGKLSVEAAMGGGTSITMQLPIGEEVE